tara:strand:+ start:1617 stop:2858 length:1242 start_codon:yes stop_codon:yes gene_type:complete
MNRKIIFCGISHLSLNYGAVAAKNNYKVIFFDYEKKIKSFFEKNLIIKEPKLKFYLNKYKDNIKFVSSLDEKIKNTLIFVAIDIKTNNRNQSNYKYINKLIEYLTCKNFLRKNPLIIKSQVKPGFTRKINWPKKLLYYQVETLIFGNAIDRAEYPERIIFGSHDGKLKIEKNYLSYLKKFKCPIINMKYEEAELSKMYINAYLVNDLILTNILSTISKKKNLDWSVSSKALKLDKRIGKYAYLEPGLGISGGNLERDIINLSLISKKLKINTKLFDVFINESEARKSWISKNIKKFQKDKLIKSKSKIGLIGLTYKINTNSIKNSPSFDVIKNLYGHKVWCYDKNLYGQTLENYQIQWLDLIEIVKNVDILFIMHRYSQLKYIKLNKNLKLIFDPYKILNKNKIKNKVRYITL